MTGVRVAWLVLAVLAAAFTVWAAFEQVGWASLSCAKTNELIEPGMRSGATCQDSTVDALGTWPLIRLGLVLMAPPVMAAILLRRWASWLAVGGLAAIAVYGLGHWDGFWGHLLVAGIPMTLAGFVLAFVHLVSGTPGRRRTTHTADVSR